MNVQAHTFEKRSRTEDGIAEGELPAHAGLGEAEWRKQVAAAFRPILSGLVLPAGVYYFIVVFLHYFTETPENFRILGTLAAFTSVTALVLFWRLRQPDISYVRLELYSLLIYGLIFANIVVHHSLHLEVPKLVYFVLLTMAVAATGVSLRLIIPVAAVSLATSILLAAPAGAEVQQHFGYIAFASSFVAVGVALLMRLAIKREIRARLRAERLHETAKTAAEYDFLTKLPNRRLFFRRLEDSFANEKGGGQLALGLVDLNGFKAVNDLYGHAFGDQLLGEVGQRLTRTCGDSAFVARLGGDEFAILVENAENEQSLLALGADIRAAIGQSFNMASTEISISAAVGFAPNIPTVETPTNLYEHADFALYRAKDAPDAAVRVFLSADEAELDSIKRVEQHLDTGELENEMFVEYQPLISVPDNRIIGFEALARWQSPQLGRVPPDVFIRAAERSGCITRLTPILLQKALDEARHWPSDLRLSFNLSARDVVTSSSISEIYRIVEQSGFDGRRIDFEITETSIMTDYERVRTALGCIRELGARISLDDFGVGYSNFQHLDELRIDKLKIDRQFVSRLGTSGTSGRIIRTMIEMCANLELACVVEGVETETELRAVVDAGAKLIQGYYFSRPMTGDLTRAYLAGGLAVAPAPVRRSA